MVVFYDFSLLKDDKLSSDHSTSAASMVNGVSDAPADLAAIDIQALSQPVTLVKPAIRHKASRSLVDMGLESPALTPKSRSLSWKSDVRGSSSMNDMLDNSSSLASPREIANAMSSMDSAISQTSISPIDTERTGSMVLSDYTMSLNREKKGKGLHRKTRFSSLQSPLNKKDGSPRVSSYLLISRYS